MTPERSFASDNNAGAHPQIIEAICAANHGHVVGYGDDPYTARAIGKFKEHFGADSEVFFVFNGTAANVLGLQALTRSHHAVICAEQAHIGTDECGAPEKIIGCKLIAVPRPAGKLTVEAVKSVYHGLGDPHHVQPKVISITQSTEIGTVYQAEEITSLSRFAHEHEMFVHMDGARIANAAAHLGLSLRQATRDLGVDVLSFGGTKNGMLSGEAVLFFDSRLARDFQYARKQAMQLASKMRFAAVQFETLLSNDLWLDSARRANSMALLLETQVRKLKRAEVVYPVEANGVFVRLPPAAIAPIQERYFFYVWDETKSIVRWMCSFDTTEQDIHDFVAFVADKLR